MASSSGCAAREGVRSWLAAAERDASVSRSETPKHGQRFPRSSRLTNRRQYLAVYGRGRRVGSSSLTLFGQSNDLDHCRIGITVSRKVGGAAQRNRVKRLLREVFRLHCRQLEPPLDLVVNAQPTIRGRTLDELEQEFLRSFRRLASRFDG